MYIYSMHLRLNTCKWLGKFVVALKCVSTSTWGASFGLQGPACHKQHLKNPGPSKHHPIFNPKYFRKMVRKSCKPLLLTFRSVEFSVSWSSRFPAESRHPKVKLPPFDVSGSQPNWHPLFWPRSSRKCLVSSRGCWSLPTNIAACFCI